MGGIRARYKKRERKELETPKILSLLEDVEGNSLPDTFKVGREAIFQLAKIQRDLFTDIEERGSGNYIVSGLPLKITGTDFSAFSFAVGQILYNQSYQSGNTDTNSGLSKQIAPKMRDQTGRTCYGGEIVASLKDLCRYAYGEEEPNKIQRAAMATLIDTIHSTPVTITFPNGDKVKTFLCVKMGVYTRAKDGAVTYHLILNPIFCENVKRNFAEFPQDLTKRLTAVTKKKTEAHYRLMRLLGLQDKRKPFVRHIDTLLEDLGLLETYRKDAARTEKKLLNLFGDMIKVGIITGYQTETYTSRKKQRISKVTFTLNPNFTKKAKEDEAEQTTEAGG